MAASSYSSIVLADNPTAYWRLGESAGPTLADQIGNAHPLTVTAGWTGHITYSVPGVLVGDADTGIANDGANAGGGTITPNFIPGATVTVEFWIKPAAGGALYNGIIGQSAGGNGIYWDGTNLKIRVNTPGGDVVNTTPFTLGKLYHVVISINAGAITFYINGKADGTGSGWTGATQFNTVLYAGGVGASCTLFDELAVYPTALSAARALLHFQASGRAPSQLTSRALVMDDLYSDYRRFYEDISVGAPIAAADVTKNLVVSRGPLYTMFIQRVHVRVNGASAGKTWNVQDTNAAPVSVTGDLGTDIAPNDYGVIDYGAEGFPLTPGKNLRIAISAAGASGIVSIEGYQKLTGIDSVSPGSASQ